MQNICTQHTSLIFRLAFTALLFLTFGKVSNIQAQDARFAQFYANPLQLNPAMIGIFEGKTRFAANYRELYSSILGRNAYRTLAASVDTRFRVMQGDFAGFGISVLRDEVGMSHFNRTRANLGGSFLKQLGGTRYATNEQYLVAGAQIGIGQRGFDWGKLWFSEQFVANPSFSYVDTNADNGEAFTEMKTNIYLDFNVGLLYYAIFEDNMSIYFGGAMHHINSPNISFLEDAEEKLYSKYVVHGGGEIPFTESLSMLPAVAVMKQSQSMSTTVGANFRYTNREWRELAIRAGLWGHIANQLDQGMLMDALTFTAILEMERWNFGISYDVTTSVLKAANNSRGAFEVSLIYVHPSKSRLRVSCPKF